jgi:branched-chain amino acid transport system permease protein
VSAYIVGGLVSGGIYAVFVLGLVLTYKSSRIFNFAHGAIAYFVAASYHSLNDPQGDFRWSIVPAAVVSILVIAPLLGLFLWAVLFRYLTRASATIRLVATIGLYVAIPPATIIIWGQQPFIRALGLAPEGSNGRVATWRDILGTGVTLNADQLAVIAAAVAVAVGLTLFLRFTTFGLQIRGTVDNPTVAGLTGTNTGVVSAVAWMIGSTTAGLAGVLLAPILGLDPSNFTLLLIASFAAVVIARMTSLPMAFAGAMLIGLAQEIIVKYLPQSDTVFGFFPTSGVRPSLPFLFMAVFLLAYRGVGREQLTVERVRSTRTASTGVLHRPLWQRLGLVPVIPLAAIVIIPAIIRLANGSEDYWLGLIGEGIALGIIFLSWTVVTGEAGMTSLCQITFAAIGAAMSAQLIAVHGWDPIPGILVGALCAVPFGILIALPILRLSGIYIALATLTFGVLAETLLFPIEDFDQSGAGVDFPNHLRPVILGIDLNSDRTYYYVVFVVFVVCALAVVSLRRSTLGLKFAAIRTSEPASATLGIRTSWVKITAFAISAFLAGLGGTLFALYANTVRPGDPTTWGVVVGLLFFAVVVTWGIRSPIGAFLGGIAIIAFPELISEHFAKDGLNVWFLHVPPETVGKIPAVLFGLGAIAVAREPRGVLVQMTEGVRGVGRWVTTRQAGRPADEAAEPVGAMSK